jgi:PIN domain nuclease of toxin-antitoxin system
LEVISPMVRLELAFLFEIGRIRVEPAVIVEAMRAEADLLVAESAWPRVTSIAAGLSWARDPFDRLIAAHALADDLPLLTRDPALLAHCPVACWD